LQKNALALLPRLMGTCRISYREKREVDKKNRVKSNTFVFRMMPYSRPHFSCLAKCSAKVLPGALSSAPGSAFLLPGADFCSGSLFLVRITLPLTYESQVTSLCIVAHFQLIPDQSHLDPRNPKTPNTAELVCFFLETL
jgi:hypothetical protein